jgi:hypothetical protein
LISSEWFSDIKKPKKGGSSMSAPAARNFDLNIEKILEGWEAKHAIREVIANALDEQALSDTPDVRIAMNSSGNWHIRDFGRGIRYEYLTQNENPEKLKNAGKVIGKFGVGLKDALATLNRRKIRVLIRSAHCDISLVEAAKHDFEDVTTLQASVSPPSDPKMSGTDFEFQGLSSAEVRAAKDFFLRFSGERVLENTSYGQILEKGNKSSARIYVTGLLVAEEEHFAFSYNITSLTAAMRRALNRERTNVGRTAYADRVKAMLLSSQSGKVAGILAEDLSKIGQGTHHDEVSWIDVAVHACQILNAQKKVLFVTAQELGMARDLIDHASNDGHEVIAIPGNVRQALIGLKDLQGNPVRDLLVFEGEWNNSFEFKFVPRDNLTQAERKVFDCWPKIVGLVGGMPKHVREIRISETMRPEVGTGRDCQGLWEPTKKRIIIRRSELASIRDFGGTLLHEITHAKSGFSDVTREFETALTEVIGTLTKTCIHER